MSGATKKMERELPPPLGGLENGWIQRALRKMVRYLKGSEDAPWLSHWVFRQRHSPYQTTSRHSLRIGRFTVLKWQTIESRFEA